MGLHWSPLLLHWTQCQSRGTDAGSRNDCAVKINKKNSIKKILRWIWSSVSPYFAALALTSFNCNRKESTTTRVTPLYYYIILVVLSLRQCPFYEVQGHFLTVLPRWIDTLWLGFGSAIGKSFRVQHTLCVWADVWASVTRENPASTQRPSARLSPCAQSKFTRALPKVCQSIEISSIDSITGLFRCLLSTAAVCLHKCSVWHLHLQRQEQLFQWK